MRFYSTFLSIIVSLASVFVVPIHRLHAAPPNIVILFADDLSYEAVGLAGREKILTPNIDRLARAGTVFTHAYNMGGWHGALCMASRTMLMTGRTLWRAHAIEPTLNQEIRANRFLPKMLSEVGYRTYYTGKWHMAADPTLAFDRVLRVLPGMPEDGPEFYHRPKFDGTDVWSPSDPVWGGYWAGGKHWTEQTADDILQLLDEASAQDHPFFIYAAFNAPHDPRQSSDEFLDAYPLEQVDVPRSFLDVYPFAEAMGCTARLRDEALAPFPRTRPAIQTHRREYFAIISHLDREIGRVLDRIDTLPQASNTIILFTSDQGLSVGHHGLMGKQNPYDVSMRSPFILKGPGVPQGKRIEEPIYIQDAMATCIGWSGQPMPSHVEYHDLRPLLEGKPSPYQNGIYYGYMTTQRAIIYNSKKLIHYPEADAYRLYDLQSDPDEMIDLVSQTMFASTVKEMAERLRELDQELHLPPIP